VVCGCVPCGVMKRREREGEKEGGGYCFDDCGGAAGSGAHSGGSGVVEIGTTEETGPHSTLLPLLCMYTNANM